MANFFQRGSSNRRSKRRTVDRGLSIGPVSIKFISIALITILSIIYLAQSNINATKGYELKELQLEKEEISLENERLEVEAGRLKALKNVQKVSQEKNMVDVENVRYPVE
jgi:hypothetical protein